MSTRFDLIKAALDLSKTYYVEREPGKLIVTACPECKKDTYYISKNKFHCVNNSCNCEEKWEHISVRLDIESGLSERVPQTLLDQIYCNKVWIDNVGAYLTKERHLSNAVLQQFKIGASGFEHVAFPFIDKGGVPRLIKYKSIVNKKDQSVYPVGVALPPIFGEYFLDVKLRYVIIVEGEWDCIALTQMGFENVLSIAGSNTTSSFIARLNSLGKFEKYYLLCDTDKAGQTVTVPPLQKAWKDKTYNVLLPFKDANDCLKNSIGKTEIQELMDRATPYDMYGLVMGEWWLLPDGSYYNSLYDTIQKKESNVKIIIEQFIDDNSLTDGKASILYKELMARFLNDVNKHVQCDYTSALGLERLSEAKYIGKRLVSLDSSLYFLRQNMPQFKLPEYDSTIEKSVWTPLCKLFKDPQLTYYALYIWIKNLKDAAMGRGIFEQLVPIIQGGQGTAKDKGLIALLHSPVPGEYVKAATANELNDAHLGYFVSNAIVLTFSEMQGFSKSDADNIKRVLTTSSIPVRRMYTQDIVNIHPMFVGIGSSNRSFYDIIKDETGARRFIQLEMRDEVTRNDVIAVLDQFRIESKGNEHRFDATPLYQTVDPNKDSKELEKARDKIRDYQKKSMTIDAPLDLFVEEEEQYFPAKVRSNDLWSRWKTYNPYDRTLNQTTFYAKINSVMITHGWAYPKRGQYEKLNHVPLTKTSALWSGV